EKTCYNSTSSGSILIVIAQFSNSTTTNNFFNKEMIALKSEQAKIINGSYDTFNYSYISFSYTPSFIGMGIAVGYSDNFFFLIVDNGVLISNFNTLIQDQINAMM
ncbi:MAG: hypothetical protein ACP5RI_03890, partial [Candidatus Micrarchaeia archaeon]